MASVRIHTRLEAPSGPHHFSFRGKVRRVMINGQWGSEAIEKKERERGKGDRMTNNWTWISSQLLREEIIFLNKGGEQKRNGSSARYDTKKIHTKPSQVLTTWGH